MCFLCCIAAVLEAALLALVELVKDEDGRELLAGNKALQERLEAICSEQASLSPGTPATTAQETAGVLLKDIRRPPLA